MMTQAHVNTWWTRGGTVVVLWASLFTAGCMHHPGGIAPSTKPLGVLAADHGRQVADALVDVTVDGYYQYFILFSRACTQVHGIAVESK